MDFALQNFKNWLRACATVWTALWKLGKFLNQ